MVNELYEKRREQMFPKLTAMQISRLEALKITVTIGPRYSCKKCSDRRAQVAFRHSTPRVFELIEDPDVFGVVCHRQEV